LSGRPPGAAPLPGRAAEPEGRLREKVMDSITRDNWERFYDRVVVRGRNWPRRLWFAAVEDGLRAGLSAQSPLLAQYRQDVAELAELERAGAPRDRARQQQLEGEIKRLIAIADQSIRDSAEQPRGREARLGLWLGALSLGVVVFCGALLGLTYHQQQRASERMQLEFAALQQRLIEQAADQRSVLEARIASIERDRANLGALEAGLRARADEFDRLLGASGAAGASALAGQDGVVSALQERAATLERRLVQVEGDLAALAQRLPDLDGGVKALAERLETSRAALERVEGQVAAIQAQAPELALWLEGRRQALARDLESRGAALGKLDAEI